MSANVNINPKAIIEKLKEFQKNFSRHITFAAIMVVLFVYLFVVFRISQYSQAEPSPEQESIAGATLPRVDKNAIEKITALEKSNSQVHSLFNTARKNPFHE